MAPKTQIAKQQQKDLDAILAIIKSSITSGLPQIKDKIGTLSPSNKIELLNRILTALTDRDPIKRQEANSIYNSALRKLLFQQMSEISTAIIQSIINHKFKDTVDTQDTKKQIIQDLRQAAGGGGAAAGSDNEIKVKRLGKKLADNTAKIERIITSSGNAEETQAQFYQLRMQIFNQINQIRSLGVEVDIHHINLWQYIHRLYPSQKWNDKLKSFETLSPFAKSDLLTCIETYYRKLKDNIEFWDEFGRDIVKTAKNPGSENKSKKFIDDLIIIMKSIINMQSNRITNAIIDNMLVILMNIVIQLYKQYRESWISDVVLRLQVIIGVMMSIIENFIPILSESMNVAQRYILMQIRYHIAGFYLEKYRKYIASSKDDRNIDRAKKEFVGSMQRIWECENENVPKRSNKEIVLSYFKLIMFLIKPSDYMQQQQAKFLQDAEINLHTSVARKKLYKMLQNMKETPDPYMQFYYYQQILISYDVNITQQIGDDIDYNKDMAIIWPMFAAARLMNRYGNIEPSKCFRRAIDYFMKLPEHSGIIEMEWIYLLFKSGLEYKILQPKEIMYFYDLLKLDYIDKIYELMKKFVDNNDNDYRLVHIQYDMALRNGTPHWEDQFINNDFFRHILWWSLTPDEFAFIGTPSNMINMLTYYYDLQRRRNAQSEKKQSASMAQQRQKIQRMKMPDEFSEQEKTTVRSILKMFLYRSYSKFDLVKDQIEEFNTLPNVTRNDMIIEMLNLLRSIPQLIVSPSTSQSIPSRRQIHSKSGGGGGGVAQSKSRGGGDVAQSKSRGGGDVAQQSQPQSQQKQRLKHQILFSSSSSASQTLDDDTLCMHIEWITGWIRDEDEKMVYIDYLLRVLASRSTLPDDCIVEINNLLIILSQTDNYILMEKIVDGLPSWIMSSIYDEIIENMDHMSKTRGKAPHPRIKSILQARRKTPQKMIKTTTVKGVSVADLIDQYTKLLHDIKIGNQKLKTSRDDMIALMQRIFNDEIILSGSYFLGVALPKSDLDFQIYDKDADTASFDILQKKFMLIVQRKLNSLFINKYSIRLSRSSKSILFVESSGIQMDISLTSNLEENRLSLENIKGFIDRLKWCREIILINKKYLSEMADYMNTYMGGLSSYGLTLMVIIFLLRNPRFNVDMSEIGLIRALHGFYYFYGYELIDTRLQSSGKSSSAWIPMHQKGLSLDHDQSHHLIQRPDKDAVDTIFCTLFIENPINNEKNAIGGNQNKYHLVQKWFQHQYDILNNALERQQQASKAGGGGGY